MAAREVCQRQRIPTVLRCPWRFQADGSGAPGSVRTRVEGSKLILAVSRTLTVEMASYHVEITTLLPFDMNILEIPGHVVDPVPWRSNPTRERSRLPRRLHQAVDEQVVLGRGQHRFAARSPSLAGENVAVGVCVD